MSTLLQKAPLMVSVCLMAYMLGIKCRLTHTIADILHPIPFNPLWPMGGLRLSADFNHAYQWDLMPATLDSQSNPSAVEAVARLISDMGIATNMVYGCNDSLRSAYADDVLDVYFRYQPSMEAHHRSNYPSDKWFALLKAELDADPPRPVMLSVFLPNNGGGHETVVDGYQAGPTDKVHINFGWAGSYNGFNDITNTFITGFYSWDSTSQVAITRIEPLNAGPTAYAGNNQVALAGGIVKLLGKTQATPMRREMVPPRDLQAAVASSAG